MSQTESKIKLIFEGVERGVGAAAARASKAVKGLDDDNSKLNKSADKAGTALLYMGKGMLALGAANSAIHVVGGVAGALTQLAPAALLLPGALLAGAAAMGTFKIATAGFGDALKAGLSGDMAKFAEATKDMAPEMQAAAKAAVAFKPQIDGIKKTVQGNFWGRFSGDIKGLGGSLLPVMKQGLGDIATQMGGVAKGAVQAASTPFFRGAMGSILHSTAGFFHEVGTAAGNVLTGIVGIGKVGASYLPRLGTAISGVAKKFSDWVTAAENQDKIKSLIDGAINGFKMLGGIVKNVGSALGSVFKGLGGESLPVLEILRNLTGEVAAFLKTASAQEGLRALGDTLRVVGEVVGRVVMTAFRELMPTLVKLAPVAQEVARTLGDLLVGALETLGPIVRGVADVFNAFPGSAGLATVAVVGFVAAIKTVKAVNAVSELLGLGTAIGGAGDKAKAADGKVRGFAGGLGLIKGALAVAAIAAIAVELDKVNVAAAGGEGNLQGFERNLHNIVGAGQQLLSGDIGGIIRDIGAQVEATNATWKAGEAPVQQWAQSVGQAATTAGTAIQNFFRGLVGLPPLPPVKLDVDPATGEAHVREFVGGVSRQRGLIQVDGDVNPVTGKVTQAVRFADGSTGTITVDGERSPVDGKIHGAVQFANGSKGTVTIDGNQAPANGKINATVTYGNGRTATIQVNAATAQAIHAIAVAAQDRTMTITAIVRQRALPPGHSATGGAVIGGQVAQHFDAGGSVSGPGTGTSDSVPAMLSNGEYVATARQVRNAGGAAAFGRLMAALDQGRAPGFASGGGVGDMVKWGSVSAKVWNQLLAQGWKGRAGDNQEALYRPVTKALAPTTKSLGEVAKRLGDVVRWGQVTTAKWDALIAAGWKGRAGDKQEALYRPALKTGLSGALGELASRLAEGGSVFEDLSFRGMSSNLRKYNDQIADMFYKQNSGFDVKALAGWLRKQQGSTSSSSDSGGGTFQLVVGPGADAAAGAFIAGLVRTGKLQLKAA